MWNWAKQQLADAVGTEEPIYGSSAITPVTLQAYTTPYTELTREDLRWATPEVTCVETQSFYITADSGHLIMVQLIYNDIAGLRVTTQLTTKVSYPTPDTPHIWSSDALTEHAFDATKHSFSAKDCSITLSPDGDSYIIKSTVNSNSIVDLTVRRAGPGFVVGKNGTSNFGPDPTTPRGTLRHAFWPRCRVTGTITTSTETLDVAGLGLFVHALQGMKPHHLASRWNFVDFQSESYSAVMMEYTTPPSYGNTVVNVGGIVTDHEILYAGAENTATHTASTSDELSGWPIPTSVKLAWGNDKTQSLDGKPFSASMDGDYGTVLDTVDVMGQVPKFVKQIVSAAAGTRPFIFQFNTRMTLNINRDGKHISETGRVFAEATFIN